MSNIKADLLVQTLQKFSQSANRSPENIILLELQETPLEHKVRQFYDEQPYHQNPPHKDLKSRIEDLNRDWSNWVIPITLENKRTLDVGCGCGFNLAIHGALASVAVGIDVSLNSLHKARLYTIDNNVSDKVFLIRGDIRHLDFPDGSFDLITCIGVLHHIPDCFSALANIARLLDTAGILLLGVYHPGGRYWHRTKRKILNAIIGDEIERKMRWAKKFFNVKQESQKYGIPEDIYIRDSYAVPVEKAFTVKELTNELSRLGLDLMQVRPSPAISFRKPIEEKARKRLDEKYYPIPVDSKTIDKELSRIKRHHYWCLAQKR